MTGAPWLSRFCRRSAQSRATGRVLLAIRRPAPAIRSAELPRWRCRGRVPQSPKLARSDTNRRARRAVEADRKARAWHITLMPQGSDEPPRKCGLANSKRSRERNDVARPGGCCEPRTKFSCRFLILQDHRDPRGIVRMTVVPFPFFDSSSTVPPCASMNWRVSGKPSPSAASPLKPASLAR